MRRKRKYRTDNHGYTTTIIGDLIPGGCNIYSNHKKVKEQIKELYDKEQKYIESMTGECIAYNIKQ